MKALRAVGVLLLAACLAASCAVVQEGKPGPAAPALAQAPFAPDSGTLAVRCGGLIDGVADAPLRERGVIIRDGRIEAVVAAADLPRDLPLLDLAGYTCLPGLIDMHTHLTDRPGGHGGPARLLRAHARARRCARAKQNAAATLLAGFTSVRDVGTYVAGSDRALRDAIARGEAVGPRMQVAGPYLTIPRGGGDLYVPGHDEPRDNARFHAGVARGAGEFRAKARANLEGGADLLEGDRLRRGARLRRRAGRARDDARRDRGGRRRSRTRPGGKSRPTRTAADSIEDAILAGVDTIEHASYLDDVGIALARERRVALAMDVYNGDYIDTEGRKQGWPEEFLRKNIETTEIQRQAFRQALAAGVPHRLTRPTPACFRTA